MKKAIVVSLLIGFMASFALAIQPGLSPSGIGAKYGAMGGAAASIVDDITSAYYNPAGINSAGHAELKLGAGAATEGLNQLVSIFSNATNPAKFMSDNYANSLSINGGLNAIVGLNVARIGISVIPVGALAINKAANTVAGTATAMANYEGILTLGYSFSIPGLPIASLDLGANIKSANNVTAASTATALGTTFESTDTTTTHSGIGYDIGAKASINTLIVPLSIGIVMKDISEILKGKTKTVKTYYDANGNITSQTPTEADAADLTMPGTTVISASTVIPGIGLKVAADIDSVASSASYGNAAYSLTHIGVEYPLLGIIALRAGTVSGKNPGGTDVSQTTLGAGISLGAVINVATMTDSKNSKNNSTIVDFGFAF